MLPSSPGRTNGLKDLGGYSSSSGLRAVLDLTVMHGFTIAAGLVVLSLLLVMTLSSSKALVFATLTLCFVGFCYAVTIHEQVISLDTGTQEMRDVSDPIRSGAEGFLGVQYRAVAVYALPLGIGIFISYLFRPEVKGLAFSKYSLALFSCLCFYVGCGCSALSGYTSMYVASLTNIRVASAARRSYSEALIVCFRGGAFSAVLNITLCVFGVTAVYIAARVCFWSAPMHHVPMLMVGYGFGASFVALFMQLGGGIYTKAADVGADLVGKIERVSVTAIQIGCCCCCCCCCCYYYYCSTNASNRHTHRSSPLPPPNSSPFLKMTLATPP